MRLFCPAILVPDGMHSLCFRMSLNIFQAFKLVDAPPNEEARRILVLVAKNLQNISNGAGTGTLSLCTHIRGSEWQGRLHGKVESSDNKQQRSC